jgi:hypothetical protein
MKLIVPRWTKLRALGNSPAVRLTILIPIVGYLVLLNENVLQYLDLSREVYGVNAQAAAAPPISTTHVTWQLLFVYFGLSTVALAATLYALFCPEPVKRYPSSIDMVAHAMGHTGDSFLDSAESEVKKESLISLVPLRNRFDERIRASTSPAETKEALTTYHRDTLHVFFVLLDHRGRAARLATFYCYIVGFAVLGVPATYTFYRVALLSVSKAKEALGL